MNNIIVGHIVSCEAIPNKTNLKKCIVDVGEEEAVTIVRSDFV